MKTLRSIALTLALVAVAAHTAHAQGILTPQGGFRLDAPGAAADTTAARIGSTDKDLTFTPVAPCRVADTRVAGGIVGANATRSFLAVAVSSGVNFTFQGGSNTDCGVAAVNASAVTLNVTAVTPAAAGYSTVYPFGATQPTTASINYAAGAIVNNTVVVGIPNPLGISDFTIYTFAASHYVIDIVGYYSLPEATPQTCVGTSVTNTSLSNGANTFVLAPVCPAGYQTTSAYCWGGGIAGVYSTGSGLDGNNPANRAFCGWQNSSGGSATVSTGAICCRVPGK